jgi:hypothetical protein
LKNRPKYLGKLDREFWNESVLPDKDKQLVANFIEKNKATIDDAIKNDQSRTPRSVRSQDMTKQVNAKERRTSIFIDIEKPSKKARIDLVQEVTIFRM